MSLDTNPPEVGIQKAADYSLVMARDGLDVVDLFLEHDQGHVNASDAAEEERFLLASQVFKSLFHHAEDGDNFEPQVQA